MFAEINGRKTKIRGFPRDLRTESGLPHAQAELSIRFDGRLLAFNAITINPGLLPIVFEQRADGKVPSQSLDIYVRRLLPLLIYACGITVFRLIAFRNSQVRQELWFKLNPRAFLRQSEGAAGITDYLNRFHAGKFVEEPAATCKH